MSFPNRRRRMCQVIAAAVATTSAALVSPLLAATATVSVSATPAGVTPRFMGYNMGHYMPGSNTSAWTQYTGINAFRFWAAPSDYEPTDDRAPFGDGVTDLSSFDARKSALRADLRVNPASTTYVNWTYFNPKFDATQSGRNKVQLNYTLSEVQKLGADVVTQITRSNASQYEIADWAGKWEQWQHYYAMAFYAAKNYDVQRYQMYNEPDLDDIPISEWVQRLQLASDAVKSAIEDVNTITGKKLAWSMYAPVAADQDGTIDTWGKAALNANRTDYAGRPTNYDIFDTYDVHRYSNTGYSADQTLFDSKIPGYNASGKNLPVTYTEFNRYTSGTFSTKTETLDTPSVAAEFGGILPNAMSQDVKGMYAFKFNQTEWTSSTTGMVEPQKTGFHYVDNTAPYNITGSTRAAETFRLAVKAFKGERPRFSPSVSSSDSTYDATASYDPAHGNYYYYSVNRNTTDTRTVTLDLSNWNVPAGTLVSVQEVSSVSWGAGKSSQFMTVPSTGSKTISFTQPKTSTWLLTAPAMSQTQVNLNPTADAQVSHATPTANFGLLTSAKIDRTAATADDDAAYLKFNLAAQDKAKIGRAFLHVTGVNTTDNEPVHVYGILNDSWTETGITWGNAPDLSTATDAKLANVGTDAFPVGQLAWGATSAEWGIDVTDFVRRHPDADVSFVLIREQRFAAYGTSPNIVPGDTDTSRVTINTREAASGKPRLSLMMTANPTYYWNTNFNGNFAAGGSWDAGGGVPNAASAVAVFGDFITSPHTVTVGSAATVGELRFFSLNEYTLSGSATLTLNSGGASPAAINVYQGSHVISTPIALAGAADIFTDKNTTLTIAKPISGSGAIAKKGAGTLVVTTASGIAGDWTISGGSVQIRPIGPATAASALNTLAFSGTGQLDLRDNDLIVRNGTLGTWSGGAYNGITGSIASGRNGGAWNGPGITATSAAGSLLMGLGVATADDIGAGGTTWSGQLVGPNDVLVRYTFGGDADLSGGIDVNDYFRIDAGFLGHKGGWLNGDFDYNGRVDGDDYFIIDSNFADQTTVMAASPTAVAAVPEPAAVGFIAFACGFALARRRRNGAKFN